MNYFFRRRPASVLTPPPESVVDGQVGDWNVVVGHPVEPLAEPMLFGEPDTPTRVAGRPLTEGSSPRSEQSVRLFQGFPSDTVVALCPLCSSDSSASSGGPSASCSACRTQGAAGEELLERMVCPECRTPNMMQPGSTQIRCGHCRVVVAVPAAQVELQRAILDDLRKAMERGFEAGRE